MEDGRYFLGVGLSDEARHRLASVLEDWVDRVPGRRTRPESWHITLRFLGHVPGADVEVLLGSLQSAELTPPFTVELARLGAFPRPRRATVLWVGVTRGAEALAELAGAVEEAARGAGFSAEERPFHGHVTLSRVRPPESVEELIEAVPPVDVAWRVEAVTLFRSRLGRGGARYEIAEQVSL